MKYFIFFILLLSQLSFAQEVGVRGAKVNIYCPSLTIYNAIIEDTRDNGTLVFVIVREKNNNVLLVSPSVCAIEFLE